MSGTVIKVENLSKLYRLGEIHKQTGSFRDMVTQTFARIAQSVKRKAPSNSSNAYTSNPDNMRLAPSAMLSSGDDSIWALRGVSFEVKRGEVLGIIGRNGAGKSTLLKILSRITKPTEGYAEINGRVSSLLEVGTGFHPELTGRENIYLNSSILGMSKTEINRKFDQIVDFAEIERFIDTPVKRYSSGMYVRLAFAVAAHIEPEIMLVDEVLAVGDAGFQKKCLGKMGDVAKEGRTILFVSHNMAAVRRLCERTLLIEQGQITYDGETSTAIDRYLQYTASTEAIVSSDELQKKANIYSPDNESYFTCEEIALLDQTGQPRTEFKSNEEIIVSIKYRCLKRTPMLNIIVRITNSEGKTILRSDSLDDVEYGDSSFIPLKEYQSQCVLPSNFFGQKHFFVNVTFEYQDRYVLFFQNILNLNVIFQGYSNYSKSSKGGDYIRPKLEWRTVQVYSDE